MIHFETLAAYTRRNEIQSQLSSSNNTIHMYREHNANFAKVPSQQRRALHAL